MTELVAAETRLEAWLQASELLLDSRPLLNVVLSISNPVSDGAIAAEAYRILDEHYKQSDDYPLHTVAETIFPGWEYHHRGLRGVFDLYADEEYERIKSRWGTYAYRLLRRTTKNGETINPLEVLIDKMRSENSLRGTKRACYELGVAAGEYEAPLYNAVDDGGLRMGGPCLSHLSFKLFEERVYLTAMYRSHDYQKKAPGNLLGLARLQACVAREVGAGIGSMVVHSTYAWLGGRVTGLRSVIEEIRSLPNEVAAK